MHAQCYFEPCQRLLIWLCNILLMIQDKYTSLNLAKLRHFTAYGNVPLYSFSKTI